VFFHDTAWDSWYRMLDEKRLRPDLHGVGSPSEADYAFVHYELHMLESEYQNWVATETLRPEYLVRQDDVPIAAIYHRP
jgi:hypothetical protein